MPDPNDFKTKKNWMGACMRQNLKVEGKEQDQAVAICLNMWREKHKKKVRKPARKKASEAVRSAAEALMLVKVEG